MKTIKEVFPKAAILLLIFSVICGLLYTAAISVFAQVVFPDKANGSIIEIDGKKYGSELLGQEFNDANHMWGRIMNIDTNTYTDKDGNKLMYAIPSNMSPASDEYKLLIEQRVVNIKAANPEAKTESIPVDLVTCSGSGLDPHISVAAATYQIPRLVANTNLSSQELEKIIEECTNSKLLGIFGEETVNVLKVNLMIEGILK
ncbi:MAG: K(+)-transporting ATPase subunit C [Erysipelotrichaceae bacterium]